MLYNPLHYNNRTSISQDFQSFSRVSIAGKFFCLGDQLFFMKGCTYGPFVPDASGVEYNDEQVLRRDFSMMKAHGFNCVRIPHAVPPRHLLDIAQEYGLRVIVSLACEQYIGHLIDNPKKFNVIAVLKEKVEPVLNHPAIFCYSLGNEIRPSLVRWIGPKKIERFIGDLARKVRSWDPTALVTYANFPTTEYLQFPDLDFLSFNVYLEDRDRFRAYLDRLQNLAHDRPLIMAEVGVDSVKFGLEGQAEELHWLLEETFAAGCAGASVFTWSDDWFVKRLITDWNFGLTDYEKRPKPALAKVAKAFQHAPFKMNKPWPFISVVVCSYNGARTITETLEALTRMRYPNFEVIVVNDGSTDATAEIASRYEFQLITTPNQGLSAARNLGWQSARGSIIAYLDDDAFPPPDWLFYIAEAFEKWNCAAVGGPNFPPLGRSLIADAIGFAPGGPRAVLTADTEAEHIPGCNMCIRRDVLQKIGGFDPQFRVAGDDVDIAWRILDSGGEIRYHGAAFVWHYARQRIKDFWRQQAGYGKAEALLQKKWPEKYNEAGHPSWKGNIYGANVLKPLLARSRIYFGEWGSEPFQSKTREPGHMIATWALMPEWQLVMGGFLILGLGGFIWSPLFGFFALFAVSFLLVAVNIFLHVKETLLHRSPFYNERKTRLIVLTTLLFFMQPLARLYGRMRYQLRPWWRKDFCFSLPWSWQSAHWSESYHPNHAHLQNIQSNLQQRGVFDRRGSVFDAWDLQITGGLCGKARMFLACEDYGTQQMIRAKVYPSVRPWAKILMGSSVVLAVLAYREQATMMGHLFSIIFFAIFVNALLHCAIASGTARQAFQECIRCQNS